MEATSKKRRSSDLGKLVFFVGVIILSIAILATLPRLTLPLGLAYVAYLIISPIIPRIKKFGLSQNGAIAVIFLGIISVSVFPIITVVPTIKGEAEKIQYYIPKVERYLIDGYHNVKSEVRGRIGYEMDDKFLNDILVYGTKSSKALLLKIPQVLASLLEWAFLVPLFLFFMLSEGRKFKYLFLKFAPNMIFERLYYLGHQFNKQLGGYIFAKFVEASIVGSIITTGLLVLGVEFSFLLGLIAGLTNIIPYVGPFLGIVPGILLCLVKYGTDSTTLAVLILYMVANVIDLALVFPILVSKIVNLHPLLVVVSVILGSQYMGVVGMVISIPLLAAAKLIFTEIVNEIYGNSSG
jgi:putative permease